jgi:hypothetical protein
MSVRLLAAMVMATGCSRAPAPVCPTPATTGPTDAEAATEPERETEDEEAVAGAMSVDGLFACSIPRGDLEVTMREHFTAKDLVLSYMSITCTNVLLPIAAAARRDRSAAIPGGRWHHAR